MLHFYGFILAIAIIASFTLFHFLIRCDSILSKINPPIWQKGFIITLICGLIGARLYHILDFWSFYSQQPIEIVKAWNGGLGILGAVIFGGGGLMVFLRWKKLPALKIFDFLAPCLALGQVIGRWANFFNQEIYGYPTELRWGIFIDKVNRLPGFENYQFFHPLFLYEMVGNLIIFSVLMLFFQISSFHPAKGGTSFPISKKISSNNNQRSTINDQSSIVKYRLLTTVHRLLSIDGLFFFLYLILYGILRFFLEGIRVRGWMIGGVRIAQIVSLILIIGGIAGIILISKFKFQMPNQVQNPKSK